ncbi:MAG: thiamine pyrophosphate-requiring protein [Actinomycetota bacterium]
MTAPTHTLTPTDAHQQTDTNGRTPMDGNELIARILEREGVEWLACFPNNPLIEAAAKIGIRPIAFRHERGAVMAADGYSRLSDRRRFGVVAVQSQAGAENALGGVAQSFADNIPILVLPGGPNSGEIAVRPNYSAEQNYAGITKSVESLRRSADIGAAMRRAFAALRNGTPGPVVVELTADVCREQLADDALDRYISPPVARQVAAADSITAAVDALLAADRPLLWAGGGVLFADATAELRELAELTATPVFTTMQGKSAIDEAHPMSVGAGGMTTTGPAARFLGQTDLLVALGSSLTRTPYGQRVPRGVPVIQNTNNPNEVGKDENVTIALVGDTKLTLQALIEEARARLDTAPDASAVAAEIAAARDEWLTAWAPALTSDEVPLSYYRVIDELNNGLDRANSIVTHDAGAPRDCLVPFFQATTPHSYVGWGKTTHLGFGIPLMIGAKLAHPDKFCLNVMGDGAFGMSGTDIETAVRSGAAITTVLLNNGNMATYPHGSPMDPTTARTEFGVTTMLGDYAKIAEGMGAIGITVRTPEEFRAALADAKRHNAEGATVLIDVHANVEARRSPHAPPA